MKLLEAVKSLEIFTPVSKDEEADRESKMIEREREKLEKTYKLDKLISANLSSMGIRLREHNFRNIFHNHFNVKGSWAKGFVADELSYFITVDDNSTTVIFDPHNTPAAVRYITWDKKFTYSNHKNVEAHLTKHFKDGNLASQCPDGFRRMNDEPSLYQKFLEKDKGITESTINELTIPQLNYRNKSVYNRFSDRDEKVDAVAAAGGIRWKDWTPNTWRYVVKSASLADVWYDVYVRFDDIEDIVKNSVSIDYRELAKEVLSGSNVRTVCSCPADLYFHQYNRTKENSKYTTPEKRPANKTNPAGDGIRCKHQDLVFKQLPFYTTKMAAHIKHFFPKGGDNEQPKEDPKPDQPQPVAQGVKPAAEPVKSKEKPGVASIVKDPQIDAIIQKAFDKRTPNKIGDQSQIKK